ncbi:MAG TPA: hypothetical protein VFZ69_06135 [Longimicrobiales bacterium]
MIQRVPFRVVLLAVIAIPASCVNAPDAEVISETDGGDVLTADVAAEPDLNGFASRQRSFLEALAGGRGDPTAYMSPHFTFRDRADPSDAIGRGAGGVPGFGIDYLRALSERVPAVYAQTESMEMLQQRSDEVVVITRHPGVLPTVTRWERRGSEWKAVSLVLNVDEAVLAEFARSTS